MNHLIGLSKTFDKEELNIKVLKCLDRSWHPKVTVISETRDLTTLSTTAIFGKLREHEIEMNRLKEQKNGERKARSISLKTTALAEDSEADSSCDSEVETLNMLMRKFNKFLKKRGKEKNQQTKRYTKKTNLNSTNLTCFGCGRQRHIKAECSNLNNKDKPAEKKKFSKSNKGK